MSTIVSKPASAVAPAINSANIVFGKEIILNGVSNIIESNEKIVVANMGDNVAQLYGENLTIDLLDISTGTAKISGNLTILKYSKGREKLSFIKKLIK